MEQHAAVAEATADGKLTLLELAPSARTTCIGHWPRCWSLAPSRIRVIATPNGGGFGGKSDPFDHEIVVAKLALMTGRPVKICLTREEVFYCHRGRHPILMKIRTGVTRDGAITAMDFESYLDGGAYGSYGVASTYYTGALQTVTYDVPAYRFKGVRAFTNKAPCGPKRGHGTPQPRFALEVQLDKIAEELRLDPAEMRLRTWHSPTRSLPTGFESGRSASVNALKRSSPARAGRSATASCPMAAALGWPARLISRVLVSRSTGMRCPTPACRSSATGAVG